MGKPIVFARWRPEPEPGPSEEEYRLYIRSMERAMEIPDLNERKRAMRDTNRAWEEKLIEYGLQAWS